MAVVTGGCSPSLSFAQVGQVGTNPAARLTEAINLRGTFANGTAANQVNLIHAFTYVLAASTPQTIDLQAIADISGATVDFSRVDFLAYRIQSTNDAHTVTLGGAGSDEWNGWLTAGSTLLAFPSTAANDGYAIVQAPNTTGMAVSPTSRLLKIDPGTNAVGNFDLVIVGRA